MSMKFDIRRELKEIFFLGAIASLTTSVPFCWGCDLEEFLRNYAFSAIIWISMAKGNSYLTNYISNKISWLEAPVKRFVVGVLAMITYSTVMTGIIYVLILWSTSSLTLLQSIDHLTWDQIVFTLLITVIISQFLHARGFLLDWRKAVVEAESFKRESINSRYQSLKNQVNPHFLFNSLNVLSGLVYTSQDKAVAFIRKLSDVYRYLLDNREEEVVSLDDELSFLDNYVYLQKIRFGDSLKIRINREVIRGAVPPLAVQLLVENAIKHNVVSESKPLSVSISIGVETITVENTIQEKLSKDSTGIGLSNLKERYSYLSQRPVEIINDQKTFKVILPVLTFQS